MRNLPDFLIIGAMKCGTSTLQAQLAAQDGVFMTTPKEPNFFSDDDVYSKGMGWYQGLFADAAPPDLKGEASTHYTKLPTYPQTLSRLRSAVPTLRLIYMIRNPLERAISHYIHGWTMGDMGSDPLAAFSENKTLVEYGCYGMQITPFIEAYGKEAVYLTSLEQIKADPDTEFRHIANFLGLSASTAWQHEQAPQNVSAERIKRFPMQRLLIDNPVATLLRRTLIPQALRDRVKEVRQMRARPSLSEEQQSALKVVFQEDREVLAAHFPNHPALNICYPFVSDGT